MNRLVIGAWLAAASLFAASVLAKLPPLSEEAQAKAAEAAARTAWSNKVADYKLCQAMDRTAERYQAAVKLAGKEVPPPVLTPGCADPGPFVYAAPAAKPLEAAGAHSPPETAKGPPSGTTPQAEKK